MDLTAVRGEIFGRRVGPGLFDGGKVLIEPKELSLIHI